MLAPETGEFFRALKKSYCKKLLELILPFLVVEQPTFTGTSLDDRYMHVLQERINVFIQKELNKYMIQYGIPVPATLRDLSIFPPAPHQGTKNSKQKLTCDL